MKVSVSILKEKDNINEVLKKLDNTNADYIHLDIMDSTFTDNSSFKLSDFLNLSLSKKYDIHIMSTNLDYQINEAIKLKPEFITFHVEATDDVKKYIDLIKNNSIKVGLAISPDTKLEEVYNYLSDIDLLLVMSVVPGMGGQEFITSTIDKLKQIDKKRNIIVSVDGGINNETIDLVRKYTDMVVSGSYITSSDNYKEKIDTLK